MSKTFSGKEKIKIGIDGRDLFREEITGIGRFVLNFLNGIKVEGKDHEYILFLNERNYFDIEAPTIKKVVIKENSTLAWDQILLPYALKKEKIDLLFSPYFKAPLFAHCKVITSILDIIPFVIEPYKSSIKTRLNRIAIKMFSHKAKKIITISHYSKGEITKYFNIPHEKIEVIYLCPGKHFTAVHDFERISQVKNKHGISGEYILYVGNLKPHKNLIRLLHAYSLLPEHIQKDFQLVIGGKKDENYKLLFKRIIERDIAGKVVFTDFIPDNELPSLYSGATLFVFPSLCEGFGLPILEAMACGVPVITSNSTSIPEITGDAAILVDPEDIEGIAKNISRIIEDKDLQKGIALKGLERVRLFSIEDNAKRMIRLFEGI